MEQGKEVQIVYAENVGQQDSRVIPWHIRADGDTIGAANYYCVHWNMLKEPEPEGSPRPVGHPPHIHKETEVIMLIGTDPENPYDLGGTVEFCAGKDMKKYTVTRSCTIVFPGYLPHGFYHIVETHRPFLHVQIQEAAPRTEKFLWQYLTAEEIASMKNPEKWQDAGFSEGEPDGI